MKKKTKRKKTNEIRWPKNKTAAQLRRMSRRAVLTYGMKLHEAWGEKNRRAAAWDEFWMEFYKRLLKDKP